MSDAPENIVNFASNGDSPGDAKVNAETEQQKKIIDRAMQIAADVLESDSRRMGIVCRTQPDMPERTWHELADASRCLISAANYLRNRTQMIAEGERQVMDNAPLPIMPGDKPGIIIP